MKNQAVFNRVVKHLLTQKKQALSDDGTCMYRTEDGRKCAVGCLIKNKYYDDKFEGNSVGAFPYKSPLIQALIKSGVEINKDTESNPWSKERDADVKFLSELQKVHDNNPPRYWKSLLKVVARDYKLKWPEGW